jgi:predicted enzyme related to lactoylglutathione lyase
MQKRPGISAITLFVEDLDNAKNFYEQVFGLPVHYEDPHSAVFKFGGTLVKPSSRESGF